MAIYEHLFLAGHRTLPKRKTNPKKAAECAKQSQRSLFSLLILRRRLLLEHENWLKTRLWPQSAASVIIIRPENTVGSINRCSQWYWPSFMPKVVTLANCTNIRVESIKFPKETTTKTFFSLFWRIL